MDNDLTDSTSKVYHYLICLKKINKKKFNNISDYNIDFTFQLGQKISNTNNLSSKLPHWIIKTIVAYEKQPPIGNSASPLPTVHYCICTNVYSPNIDSMLNMDLILFFKKEMILNPNVKEKEKEQQRKKKSNFKQSTYLLNPQSSSSNSSSSSKSKFHSIFHSIKTKSCPFFTHEGFNKINSTNTNNNNNNDHYLSYEKLPKNYCDFTKLFNDVKPNESIIVATPSYYCQHNNQSIFRIFQMKLRGILFDLNLMFDMKLLIPFLISIHSMNDLRPFIYSDFDTFYKSTFLSSKKSNTQYQQDPQHPKNNLFNEMFVKLNNGTFVSLQTLLFDEPLSSKIYPLKTKTLKEMDHQFYKQILENPMNNLSFLNYCFNIFENPYYQNQSRIENEEEYQKFAFGNSSSSSNNNLPFLNVTKKYHLF